MAQCPLVTTGGHFSVRFIGEWSCINQELAANTVSGIFICTVLFSIIAENVRNLGWANLSFNLFDVGFRNQNCDGNITTRICFCVSGSNKVIDEVRCNIFDRHVTKIGDVFSGIDFIGSQIATTERINQE